MIGGRPQGDAGSEPLSCAVGGRNISPTLAPELLAELEQIPIRRGKHDFFAAGACAVELVDWLDRRRSGEEVGARAELSDAPACVCPVLAAFVRIWNDNLPTDAERSRLLRPLLPQLLDSVRLYNVAERRAWIAFDWLVRVYLPAWLALTPALASHAYALVKAAKIDSTEPCRAVVPLLTAAREAARDSTWNAGSDAPRTAASAAAYGAAWGAGVAARGAASGAVCAAARDAARAVGRAAGVAARGAASGAVCAAARDAARAVGRAAGRNALSAELDATAAQLQQSAQQLVLRMVQEGA